MWAERKDRVRRRAPCHARGGRGGHSPRRGRGRCCAVKALDGLKSANSYQKAGIEIVRRAIQISGQADRPDAGEDAGVVAASCSRRPTTTGLQRRDGSSIRIWSSMA